MTRREDWIDPDARFAWDDYEPEEDWDNRIPRVVEENPAMVTMAEVLADKGKECTF